MNTIPGIEEVNMIKDDGSVIHFNNPKVQASLGANTFAVNGSAENKQITELLPGNFEIYLTTLSRFLLLARDTFPELTSGPEIT